MAQDNILHKGVQKAYSFISRVNDKYYRIESPLYKLETKFKMLQGFAGLFFKEFDLSNQDSHDRCKIVQSLSPYTGNARAQKAYRIIRDYAKKTAQEITKETPGIKGNACLETRVCAELLHKMIVLYNKEKIGANDNRYYNRTDKDSPKEKELISA